MKKQIKKVASKVKGITKKAYKAVCEDAATAMFIGASIVDLSVFGTVLVSNFLTKKKIANGKETYYRGFEEGQGYAIDTYDASLSNYLIGSGKTVEEASAIVDKIVVPIISKKKE